jgi:hypothetical protein
MAVWIIGQITIAELIKWPDQYSLDALEKPAGHLGETTNDIDDSQITVLRDYRSHKLRATTVGTCR